MEAIQLETIDDKFLITVDRNSFNHEFVIGLVERLQLEHLAEKINFSSDIEELGENIKADWWDKNKLRLLGTQK